jgi:hypothetical protein
MHRFAIILAEGEEFGRVMECECGAIHLEAGPLDASFSPDAYRHFANLILASAAPPLRKEDDLARLAPRSQSAAGISRNSTK